MNGSYQLIKIGMFILRSIARLSLSPARCLAPVRPFFFSTSDSSSTPSPKAFETASISLNKESSAGVSGQKATGNPATPKKKLSHQAQTAIWAERVIQYILNAQPLTDIHSPSLKEQILKLQNPDNVHHFEPEPKEKVMRLFTQGVILNGHVFNQERIRDGKQSFQRIKTEQKNFIFCPNLLVTKEIFKYMMELYYNYLVTGGFGISKTVSVILFIQLSNHVNSYLFKAAQPHNIDIMQELIWLKSVPVNPFFFDQQTKDKQVEHSTIQLLTKETYFSTAIPRYWYWSIRSEALEVQQQLRQTLLLQAPQISLQKKKQLRSIENFREFVRQLKKCYPQFQSYCMKIVVDQFNAIASRARTWNKKVDQYKQMKQGTINLNQYKKDENEFKLSAQRNIELVKSVIYLSNLPKPSYILNSSTSIQQDLLDSTKGKLSQKVYFDIQTDHKTFTVQEIKYLQEINKSLIDFLHNFWFEIERKLKIWNNNKRVKEEKKIKKAIQERKDNAIIQEMKAKLASEEKQNNEAIPIMKKLFFEEVKGKKANYFSRFLFVREYLTQKKIEQMLNKYKLFKKEEKENPFKGIYESFTAESTMKYQQKMQSFFLKDQTKYSLVLFYALYDLALLQSYIGDKKEDKKLTVNIQYFVRWLGVKSFAWLNLDTYKELLPFSFTEDHKSIQFYWKPEQFISAVKDVLFEPKIPYIFDHLTLQTIERYSSTRGNFFENCIIQALKHGAEATIFSSSLPKVMEQFNIKEKHFTTFKSFNFYYIGNSCLDIVQKSQAEKNKAIFPEKNKLTPEKAKEFIKSFNQGKPQSDQLVVDLNKYDFYIVRASTISQNLKSLFDMCDQYPKQFCIATPQHKKMFDSCSECIDFIIARKYEDKYQVFTFDVSISKTATEKYSSAKTFFSQVLYRQKGNRNYKVTHVLLCHSDADKTVSYNSSSQINIIYSPWEKMTIKKSKYDPAQKAFQRMVDVNLRLSEIQKNNV